MSPHQTIAVGVRLFAVWLAFYAVGAVAVNYAEGNWQFATTIAFIATTAILILWFFPKTVAHKILAAPISGVTEPSSMDAWLAAGCALIGLWVLSSAIPALVRKVLIFWLSRPGIDDTSGLKFWVVYDLLEIALGLWLFVGSKGLRKVYWWAQSAGRK
jgi:hypothetical protein